MREAAQLSRSTLGVLEEYVTSYFIAAYRGDLMMSGDVAGAQSGLEPFGMDG